MRIIFVSTDMKILKVKGKMEDKQHDKQTDLHNQQVL